MSAKDRLAQFNRDWEDHRAARGGMSSEDLLRSAKLAFPPAFHDELRREAIAAIDRVAVSARRLLRIAANQEAEVARAEAEAVLAELKEEA